MPKGTRDTVVFSSDDFARMADLLRKATLRACDFTETVEQAGEGDFLYVDPPYTVTHNTNNFLKYNEKIFSWADQRRIQSCLALAAERGAKILVPNADHTCIHDLYRAKLWQKLRVSRRSNLASSSKHRTEASELLISNYFREDGTRDEFRS